MNTLLWDGVVGLLVPAAMLVTIGAKLWYVNQTVAKTMLITSYGYLGGWAIGAVAAWFNGAIPNGFESTYAYGTLSLAGAVIGAAIAAVSSPNS